MCVVDQLMRLQFSLHLLELDTGSRLDAPVCAVHVSSLRTCPLAVLFIYK